MLLFHNIGKYHLKAYQDETISMLGISRRVLGDLLATILNAQTLVEQTRYRRLKVRSA